MSNSYRIRTEVGVDKYLQVKLEQDYDQLDILSFSIFPNDVYTRNCPDFGVVCGRVFCNKGFGLPNAKVAIFIPISDEDELNPIISTLYPYKSFEDLNEDGYKYNLLPYTKSHSGHVPVGTFPEREDVLLDSSVIEVYDKYYKFTVKTNDSGDFMIFGVPVGQHNLFMQIDLSDIGEFSLTPQDLIRIGRATESQVNGASFKFSENYSELPQIVTLQKIIQVAPFYGQPDICDYYIVRADFDLTTESSITLEPTAVFMGSLISTNDRKKIKRTCKTPAKAGWLCDLITGPGQIETIRQTVDSDADGRPVLEDFRLENDGKIIDDNGTWVVEVPMNLEYVYTDEYGNRLVSNDPTVGVPTKGKYRFKIKWQQSPKLSEENKRGYFLVPNIKEYGWESSSNDPSNQSIASGSITLNHNSDPQELVFGAQFNDNAININNSQNVQSYEILVNDVVVPEYQTTIPICNLDSGDIVKIRYTLTDTSVDGELFVTILTESQWLQQCSYAYSLSWEDYGNDLMVNEAINCEDRFFELQYNKVYTVSQLLDRVTRQKFPYAPQKSIQIKHITDSKCEGDYNPFPTNDAYFRYDFIYLALTLILTILKFVLVPLVVIVHVLAFLWPIFAIIIIVISVIANIVIAICNGINSVAGLLGLSFDCPSPIPIDSEIFSNNPFKNIKLPLFLYTEDGCERCRCNIDGVDVSDNAYADSLSQWTAQNSLQNTSNLIDFTSLNSYGNVNYIQSVLLAGSNDPDRPCIDRVPYYNNNSATYYISSSLPIAERLNLFNTKAKYFDNTNSNLSPGNTGWNQIKVTWFPEANGNLNHFDNTLVLLIETTGFSRGDIISFQNPAMSNDINANNITGATSIPETITVRYANPVFGLGESQVTYAMPWYSEEQRELTRTTCFKADIEYFQVLDIVDFDTYKSNANPLSNNDNRFSLPWRFLDSSHIFNGDVGVNGTSSWGFDNSMAYFTESTENANAAIEACRYGVFHKYGSNLDALSYNTFTGSTTRKLLILQRGVDVHSPPISQKIDLSRLYGYPNYGAQNNQFVIEGNFRMNIPIQDGSPQNVSGLKLPRHNQILTNSDDSEGIGIFYDSYLFNYSNNFSAFTTTLPNYYSALDINAYWNSGVWNPGCSGPTNMVEPSSETTVSQQYMVIDIYNGFGVNFSRYKATSDSARCTRCFPINAGPIADCYFNGDEIASYGWYRNVGQIGSDYIYNSETNRVSGYWIDSNKKEYVEGGSAMGFRWSNSYPGGARLYSSGYQGGYPNATWCGYSNNNECDGAIAHSLANVLYLSPAYAAFPEVQTGPQDYVTPNHQISVNNRHKIVFRTDRLPTSTTLSTNGNGNGFLLHQNPTFAIFKFGTGCTYVQQGGEPANQINSVDIDYNTLPGGEDGAIANISQSLSECSKAVDLNSYGVENNQPVIYDLDPYSKQNKYLWFNRGEGCYNLVSRPILSLFRKDIPGDPDGRGYSDIAMVVEWVQRLKLNFALCFDVISHTYSNNWINGTLYAYSFQNTTFFDSQNQPYRLYCKDTIYFNDSINNYFYRSSPYDGINFIGKEALPNSSPSSVYGNFKNLLYPTTILDIGPKVEFIQELVSSDEYDGYIINQVPSTSFKNVSDILNLFVLSRLINTTFIQTLIPSTADDGNEEGGDDPSVGAFFANKRWKNGALYFNGLIPGVIDADYSQLISINSEFGLTEYSSESYDNTSVVFLEDDLGNSVFGLLLTGDTQARDYVSPRRTIWNQNAVVPGTQADFTYIPTKTQVVPFYQWEINYQNNTPSIFGYQSNNYLTNTGAFFSYKYQGLDRFNPSSEYFEPDGNLIRNFRGYIVNFDTNGNPTYNYSQSPNSPVTFGSPFNFYFGLKVGGSAMDRFITKYVNTNEVII